MENIIEVTEATFDRDVIERSLDVPVVVDFWAPWCGPCHMLSPILERLAADPELDFVLAKVNVDHNPNLSMQYQVRGIPAIKAFVDGEVEAEFTGVQPEARIRQFIQKLIPSEMDMALNEAASLLATHHWVEAEQMLRDLLDVYPNRPEMILNLAQALLAQGDGCEALEYLQKIRDGKALGQAEQLLPLARFLCRVAEAVDDETELAPLEIQYRQAARLLARGNFAAGMDGILDVLRQDKQYRKGEPRQALLGIFALLGENDTLTQTYRNELASVLF